MKKLVLALLMSCVAGTVCAAESDGKAKALSALQIAGKNTVTRGLPAIAGYMVASAVKNNTGSAGFMAFFGLAACLPFVLDTQKTAQYAAVNPNVKIALNSFAAGVVAREVVSLLPTGAKNRLAELCERR